MPIFAQFRRFVEHIPSLLSPSFDALVERHNFNYDELSSIFTCYYALTFAMSILFLDAVVDRYLMNYSAEALLGARYLGFWCVEGNAAVPRIPSRRRSSEKCGWCCLKTTKNR